MHPAIIIGTVRSLIVDVAMGQIPRSTERISSLFIKQLHKNMTAENIHEQHRQGLLSTYSGPVKKKEKHQLLYTKNVHGLVVYNRQDKNNRNIY